MGVAVITCFMAVIKSFKTVITRPKASITHLMAVIINFEMVKARNKFVALIKIFSLEYSVT